VVEGGTSSRKKGGEWIGAAPNGCPKEETPKREEEERNAQDGEQPTMTTGASGEAEEQ
jgi:hypothetical protein